MTAQRQLEAEIARATQPVNFTGAVLAGGHSRRMGRDKAGLVVGGMKLWQRQAAMLACAGAASVRIVRRREQASLGSDVDMVFDAFADIGPLAGLHAALSAAEIDHVAVLAVDMPGIGAEWFAGLAAACDEGCGAVTRFADRFEPLAAIYPRTALGVMRRRIAQQNGSLQELVAELVERGWLRVLTLKASDLGAIANWNRPPDIRVSRAVRW